MGRVRVETFLSNSDTCWVPAEREKSAKLNGENFIPIGRLVAELLSFKVQGDRRGLEKMAGAGRVVDGV